MSVLGMIKRSFSHISIESFKILYNIIIVYFARGDLIETYRLLYLCSTSSGILCANMESISQQEAKLSLG